jgi:hypothetical protein
MSQQSVTWEFGQVQRRTAALNEKAEALRQEAEMVEIGYRKLKEQFADVSGLAAEVKSLSTKVEQIEKIVFVPSPALTPDLEKCLTASLASFQAYMQRVGFKFKATARVLVQDELVAGSIAFYDPQQNCMFVQYAYATDPDVVFREYVHHLLLELQDQATQYHVYASIESGLAFYFTCSFNNNPKFGAKTARIAGEGRGYYMNLANNLLFDEAYSKMHPTQTGEVWGGAFWELRQLLGQEVADRMLFRTWAGLKANDIQGDDGKGYVKSIVGQGPQFSLAMDTTNKVQAIFGRRGLKV